MPGPSVLQVCQPPDGGVAEHVVALSAGLPARGWSVEAAVPPASPVAARLRALGLPVHELELAREPGLGDLPAARALRSLDRGGRFALVHGHSSKAGALVRAALPRSRRLVYTPHCFAFAARFGAARSLAYRLVEQALAPRSGAIVAVCEWERELAATRLLGAARRVRVIPNGVPRCEPEEPPRELLEFKGELPLAGLVSVLRPQKDPLLALRAFARAGADGSAAGRLAIVGNGELAGAVRDEIDRLSLRGRARWFPFEGGVGRYLHALDLLVLPSAWEALPLSVLEAMSCGLPVLATRVGGVPEAVEDGVTGSVVPPGDAVALGDALARLLGDAALRERMGAAGRERWDRLFRVEAMVAAVDSLYRELVA